MTPDVDADDGPAWRPMAPSLPRVRCQKCGRTDIQQRQNGSLVAHYRERQDRIVGHLRRELLCEAGTP